MIQTYLGTEDHVKFEKYLRLPTLYGRVNRTHVNYIKYRVHKKIYNWTSRSLSLPGKEIPLKSMVSVMSNYVMQLFVLPLDLCVDIENDMPKFW